MFERKPQYGKMALFFALGMITGAAVALLYAPMTGRKMQKKVADVTDKVMDAMEDQVHTVQGFVRKVATT